MTDTPADPAPESAPQTPAVPAAPPSAPTPATPIPAPAPAAPAAYAQTPAHATAPARRFNGVGLAALIIVILAWLITAGVTALFGSAFFGSGEGAHLVPAFLAFLAGAGVSLLLTVPMGVLAAILSFISFFLRDRGKALGIVAFIISLPFVAIAVFAALAMTGVLGS